MMRVQRREIDSSPNEDEENGETPSLRIHRFFTPPTPAEEIAFDNRTDSDEDESHPMRRDPNYRDWERRRRRSRASSSDSDELDRIRHRSQYNPMLRTIRCPEVEELNFYTRQMMRVGEMANSDNSERTSGCKGSCHCSSSDCDRSDDAI